MRNSIRMTCELMALTAHLSRSTRDFETRIKTTSKRVVCADPRGDSTCWPLEGVLVWHRITITGSRLKRLFSFAYCLLLPVNGSIYSLREIRSLAKSSSNFLNIFLDHFRVLSYRIHKVSSAPEVSAPILILQICMPIKDHQRTFTLERLYKLCYTHLRRDTY